MLFCIIIVRKHEAEWILAFEGLHEKKIPKITRPEARDRSEVSFGLAAGSGGFPLEFVQQAREGVGTIARQALTLADIRVGGPVVAVQVVLILTVEYIVYTCRQLQ